MKNLLNGKYQIIKPLKRGGFSTVFLAKDTKLDIEVVLKKFHLEEMEGKLQSTEKASKYSIEQEIKKAIHFNHPNIARYFDFFTLSEQDSFGRQTYQVGVMEHIPDGTLKEYTDQFTAKSNKVKSALLGTLQGIEYLHSHSVIHRDIKSDNILMSGNVPKIIDFGISKKLLEEKTRLYGEGERQSELISTAEYCSPEQIDSSTFGVNETISFGVDIWMFGVLTYYICSGKYPFGSSSDQSSMENIRKKVLTAPVSSLDWSLIPDFYKPIISKCLVKKASERPTASDLIQMFNRKEASETVVIKPQEPAIQKKSTPKPNYILYALIILFAGLVSFMGIKMLYQQEDSIHTLDIFQQDGKFGYINEKGDIIINPEFDEAFPFENGIATVHKGDSIFSVNTKGELSNGRIEMQPVDKEPETTRDFDSKSLMKIIDEFNENTALENRLSIIKRNNELLDQSTGAKSILALNDISEASMKAIFLKAAERGQQVKLDDLKVNPENGKIQYALFSLHE